MNVPYVSFQRPASGSILKDVLKSAKKSAVHAFLKIVLIYILSYIYCPVISTSFDNHAFHLYSQQQ